MISLHIDGEFVAELSSTAISLSISKERSLSVESAAQTEDFTITIEANDAVNRFFGGEGYLHHSELFNASEHTAQVICEGEVALSGSVVILSVARTRKALTYSLRVRRAAAAWATNATEKLLRELDVEYGATLDTLTAKSSWEDDSLVKYFLVHRDDYSATFSSSETGTVRRVRSVDDYHPFLNLYEIMRLAFEEGGYTLRSDFMESDYFKRLYMSGAYLSQSSSVAKEYMDFYLEKLESETSTADFSGRVTFSPLYSSNSVGYIVDVESTEEKSECYTKGNCVTVENSKLQFTPTQSVSVGFEFRVVYTTDYKIKSRTELTAFDTLYLEDSATHTFGVANLFPDQRGLEILPYFSYLIVAFDESESSARTFSLYVEVDGVERSMGSWTGRSGRIVTPQFNSSSVIGDAYLYVDGVRYDEDWALYQGYTEESGQTDVDVTIRTAPDSYTADSPKVFSAPYISGAEQGMSVTIKAGTSLKPYFAGYPGAGSWVEYEDLSRHECQISDVIESVRQLFSLVIYTDEEAREVFVEPEEDIFDSSKVWDWSDRIVEGEPITLSDCALSSRKIRKWGYQSADGVTNRTNGEYYIPGDTYPNAPEADPEQSVEGSSSPDYGSWQVEIASQAAESGTQTSLNTLFSPTQNDLDGLPIVGDRDNPDMADTLEFSPRVVIWNGLIDYNNEEIPHVYFHSAEMCETLCFEDRDGAEGLSSYRAESVQREATGRYAELTLRLSTSDLLTLMTPREGVPHRFSTFGFWIDGEWCEARLESVEAREVESPTAKCKFLLIN